MIKAIGFITGGLAVFVGLLLLLAEPGTLPAVTQRAAGNEQGRLNEAGRLEWPVAVPAAPQRGAGAAQTATAPGANDAVEVRSPTQIARSPEAQGDVAAPSVSPGAPEPAAPVAPADAALDEAALVESMFAAAEPAGAPDETPPASDGDNESALATASAPAPAATPVADEATDPDPAPTASVTPADDREWFAVWDPFHSELSAEAFASRLERLTGLDYRVVRSGPARYEVAVGFSDEAERIANLAAIEAATGLTIAGGSL